MYAAITFRRHLDGGGTNSLRGVVDALANQERDGSTASDPDAFASDLALLERLAERFRPYINTLIHGTAFDPASSMTFNELNEAIGKVRDVAQRAYVAITQVSRRMEVVIQCAAWIFEQRPRRNGSPPNARAARARIGLPYSAG